MMPSDPQERLEQALRDQDLSGLNAALAAGADPNLTDAEGYTPLEQAVASPWATKILDRFQGKAVHARLALRMHRNRAELANALAQARASERGWAWESKAPFVADASDPVEMLIEEFHVYQHIPRPPVAFSLALMRPWIQSVPTWPVEMLEILDHALYREAVEPEVDEFDPGATEFIRAFSWWRW